MVDICIRKMIELSSKKYSLLQDMLELTRAQSGTITEDGIENLQKLIAEKQTKIEEIDKLDEEFTSCFQQLKQELKVERLEEINNASIPGIKELKDTVGRIMELLEEIRKLESRNIENAEKLMDGLSSQIKKLNQGKTINAAYGKNVVAAPPSFFVDSRK